MRRLRRFGSWMLVGWGKRLRWIGRCVCVACDACLVWHMHKSSRRSGLDYPHGPAGNIATRVPDQRSQNCIVAKFCLCEISRSIERVRIDVRRLRLGEVSATRSADACQHRRACSKLGTELPALRRMRRYAYAKQNTIIQRCPRSSVTIKAQRHVGRRAPARRRAGYRKHNKNRKG